MKYFSNPFTEDKRMYYAEKELERRGFVRVNDNGNADFVILPIPAKANMFEGLEGKTVFYGAGDFNGIDYNKNELFLLENAHLTAEGALALIKEECAFAIKDSSILITGYGRIAKALVRLLKPYGADITVSARNKLSRLEAELEGVNTDTLEALRRENSYDIIINTVPHILFAKPELDCLKQGAVIFDLASFPGGVDTLYAKAKNIRLVNGRGLPSRYCEESAGVLIGKTVYNIIKEELF